MSIEQLRSDVNRNVVGHETFWGIVRGRKMPLPEVGGGLKFGTAC